MLTTDIVFQGLVLALASSRVAYSLTQDEIFRPLREKIWLRWAPEAGTIRRYNEDGSWENLPASLYHQVSHPVFDGDGRVVGIREPMEFAPEQDPRPAAFVGKLFECVYCMSFWTSLVAAAAWLAHPEFAVVMATPFALWAIANSFAVKAL